MRQQLDPVVARRPRLAAVAGHGGAIEIFDPCSHAADMPGQRELADPGANPLLQHLRHRNHVAVGRLGHDLFQRGADGPERERVGRQRAAEAVMIDPRPGGQGLHPLSDRVGQAVDGAGDTGRQHLAQHQHVGFEPELRRAAPRPEADGVGLVDDQQRAGFPRHAPQRRVEAVHRRDHADIGHMRLGQHRRHVAIGQRPFQRLDIVELDHLGNVGQVEPVGIDAMLGHHLAVPQLGLGLVDRAVIFAVEDQDLPAPGQDPGQADGEAVGIGGRHRHLPEGKPEAARQFLGDRDAILGRQHIGGAAPGDGLGDRGRHGRWGMAEQGRRIAQAEIDIMMAVDILEPRPLGPRRIDRMRRSPLRHPMQRHAVRQMRLGAPEQGGGFGMAVEKGPFLARPDAVENRRIDAVRGGILL